jgi:hypothetical protein
VYGTDMAGENEAGIVGCEISQFCPPVRGLRSTEATRGGVVFKWTLRLLVRRNRDSTLTLRFDRVRCLAQFARERGTLPFTRLDSGSGSGCIPILARAHPRHGRCPASTTTASSLPPKRFSQPLPTPRNHWLRRTSFPPDLILGKGATRHE